VKIPGSLKLIHSGSVTIGFVQLNQHTGRNLSERITSGLTFNSGHELLKNRTEGNAFGVVRFDRAMMDHRLASDDGVVLPDAVVASVIARIRIMQVGESTSGAKKTSMHRPMRGRSPGGDVG